ncbi:MAG: alpha/beta hydrolase [Proteobacteria bacterium]|nr:MAG: alpha/beta hydrolase [Pseudomonadota bacterium]
MIETVRASDGVALCVESHGDGPPVLFSCGYSTTRENFRPQVEPLVAAGFRVLLWDYRGHGDSDAPADPAAYSFEQVQDDLARVLDHFSPDAPVVLAGFSFGGAASLHFALRRPERVRALVLLDTGPGFKNPDAQQKWLAQVERIAQNVETKGLASFVESRAAATAIGRRPELPAAQRAARAIAAMKPHGVAHFGRRVSGPVPGCIDDLPKITHPALVVVGQEDEAYLRAADVMAARLPNATKVVIPRAGHVTTIEEPEAVNAAIVGFLRSLPS